jgi:predicted HicB family RNase H-like nuclease
MTYQKVNIHLRPELKTVARQAAKAEGLSLSAWFRQRIKDELARTQPKLSTPKLS